MKLLVLPVPKTLKPSLAGDQAGAPCRRFRIDPRALEASARRCGGRRIGHLWPTRVCCALRFSWRRSRCCASRYLTNARPRSRPSDGPGWARRPVAAARAASQGLVELCACRNEIKMPDCQFLVGQPRLVPPHAASRPLVVTPPWRKTEKSSIWA